MQDLINKLIEQIGALPLAEKVEALNAVRSELHEISPFKNEPVDFVRWVKSERVESNSYNPNSVHPVEMKLLETSIEEDGYTQPVVTFLKDENTHEVVDGYHRKKVGKESKTIRERILGYLPVATINQSKSSESNRMASTIRHNRARGTHSIELMSNIVSELVDSGMSDAWILKHIGMDKDELLRLKQITGLAALFKDREFTVA